MRSQEKCIKGRKSLPLPFKPSLKKCDFVFFAFYLLSGDVIGSESAELRGVSLDFLLCFHNKILCGGLMSVGVFNFIFIFLFFLHC